MNKKQDPYIRYLQEIHSRSKDTHRERRRWEKTLCENGHKKPGRNRKYQQTNYEYWNWINIKKKNSQQNPASQGFNVELYQAFRKELTFILPKTFPKTAEEGMLLNSFYEASITLTPKPKIGHTQKKLQVQKFSTEY